jgi:hypothetical protein
MALGPKFIPETTYVILSRLTLACLIGSYFFKRKPARNSQANTTLGCSKALWQGDPGHQDLRMIDTESLHLTQGGGQV